MNTNYDLTSLASTDEVLFSLKNMVIAIYLHTSYILLCILLITFLLISEIWFPFIMEKMNVGLTKDDRLLSAKILKISHDISTVELRP